MYSGQKAEHLFSIILATAFLFFPIAVAEAKTPLVGHKIVVTQNTGGSIKPGGSGKPAQVTVKEGKDSVFTITPKKGYRLVSVVTDTGDVTALLTRVGAKYKYIFQKVTGGHTITATFEKESFSLTVNISGTGGTSGAVTADTGALDCSGTLCTGQFEYGSRVVLTATPDTDSALKRWVGCSAKKAQCRVKITGDLTVTVKFKPSSGSKKAAATAVTLNRSGWSETMIYDHPLVYPQNTFLNSDGDIIVYSRGNKKFIKYSGGTYTAVYDALSLPAIYGTAWQPNAGRIIFSASDGYLYALTGGSRSTLAGPSVALGNVYAITVDPADDSFYTCSMTQGQSVYRWNASGTSSSKLATSTRGCSSIALDKTNNKLYFTETYDGEINELDLSDNSVTVIAAGVGIPGTSEPIAVALDAGGSLYSFPGASGLFKYSGGTSWTLKAASIAGAGPLLWYPEVSAFAVGNGVGSNLIKYDPSDGSAANLTDYLNATGIAQNSSGDVLLCDQNFGTKIKKATTSGLSDFAPITGTACNALENGPNGVIYAGMANGEVWKVEDNGTAAVWATGYASFPVMGVAWDETNQRLIAVNGDNATSTAYVYGIPGANPAGASLIATMTGVTTGGSIPGPAVDASGNIYLIERAANKIYKIANGSFTLTDFATSVLDSEAITVPRIEYVSAENALLVSTISTYELWPIAGGNKITLGTNNGGVDNFGINQAPDGSVLAIHSGRIFRLTHD